MARPPRFVVHEFCTASTGPIGAIGISLVGYDHYDRHVFGTILDKTNSPEVQASTRVNVTTSRVAGNKMVRLEAYETYSVIQKRMGLAIKW